MLVADLNALYRREPSLHELDFDPAGFQWIDCNDNENSVVSFMRRARDPRDFTVFVLNFTPVPRVERTRWACPQPAGTAKLLNTDAEVYGGSNMGNGGAVASEPVPSQGQPHRLRLTLPPLSALVLKLEGR